MPVWSALKNPVLSVLAVVFAFALMVLVNSLGSWLVPLLRIPPGGEPQLGWDLAWTILSGIAAIAFASRYAPTWPRSHGGVVWAVIAAASIYTAWEFGSDFPFWFVVILLVSLPVQALVGLWLGTRFRPGRP